MLILAFFDTQFHAGGDDRWRRLREARPASRQHFPLNLPSSLGEYDLALPEQAVRVVGMARAAGIDGFVIDCQWRDGAYRHDAALLAPHCGNQFGLAVRWRNGAEEIWRDGTDIAGQKARADALMTALAAIPPCKLGNGLAVIVEEPKQFEDLAGMAVLLRQAAAQAGISGLHLIANRAEDKGRFLSAGFDALIDPPPNEWHSCPPSNRSSGLDYLEVMAGLKDSAEYLDRFFPYLTFTVTRMLNRAARGKSLPLVFGAYHDWLLHPDGGATHLINYGNRPIDTHLFGLFIENAMLFAHSHFPAGQRAVFLQSWNGWLDGSQIEPSVLDGDLVYNAVRAAIDRGRYMIKTRGENPGEIETVLRERIALMCEAVRTTL